MTPTGADPLLELTDPSFARPLPDELRMARSVVRDAVADLRTVPDSALAGTWLWKGGSEEEVRYGFYRIVERFERAEVLGRATMRDCVREGAGDLIAPATAARWDLQGLLVGLPEALWDADPGGGEWTVRQTLGHVISSQRGYGIGTAWWQDRAYSATDPDLPRRLPEELVASLPEEEAEAAGTPAEVRDRLDEVLDRAAERLAGLPEDRLGLGSRWSGFAVDIGFRLGRWSSHIREHTVQVEKTLAMLDHRPTEVDRLVRLVLAGWGRAEAVAYGSSGACPTVSELGAAAEEARAVASEIAAIAAA